MKNIQDCGSCSAKFWVLIRPCNANVQAVAASDWPLENGKTATRLEHFVHWCGPLEINVTLSDIGAELQFIQIQCVPVPNTSSTQCNVLMYGLTADGKVWYKRDRDDQWNPESMKMAKAG